MATDAREFELIRQMFVRQVANRPDVVIGIGDDAAITRLPDGRELVTATDSLVAGTHFLPDADPESIGHRCLAANLSDLAAMAATPLWASLALHLPQADEAWLQAFARGFFRLADQHKVVLIGGDTVLGPLAVTVTVQGVVPVGQAVQRSGARPGDLIYVTGFPGSAAFARIYSNAQLAECFSFPVPRVRFGQALSGLASAMIDISDGLDSDLGHLLQASKLGAKLDIADLPLATEMVNELGQSESVALVLNGGEDYELCFCIPPEKASELEELAGKLHVVISCIGSVAAGTELQWLQGGEVFSVPDSSFRHFG